MVNVNIAKMNGIPLYSCVQVLKDGGEVHMALCNGQGGTPADSPMREWHNSWQVVAMAAEAGLILSEVHPFDPMKYQGYKCTGYRWVEFGKQLFSLIKIKEQRFAYLHT